jgi:predicted nuclease of restriction endonuclease-like (RecB) superfamily
VIETTIYSNNDFESLVERIQSASEVLQQDARAVINRNVTCRAWVTGYCIVEYEQNGNDRAKYGEQLLSNLSKRLGEKSFSLTNLKHYRKFYLLYPELNSTIAGYINDRFANNTQIINILQLPQKSQTVSDLFSSQKSQSVTDLFESASKSQSATDQLSVSPDGFALSLSNGDVIANPKSLFTRLSFTHIVQLLQLDDNLQRAFYAIEAMRGPWSVRELKRQIDTNYYARSGWSRKPELLAQKLKGTLATPSFKDDIKSPYFFEFLGLASKDIIEEDDLESAIVSHLKDFIMELGMGFCLEDEQKRLLIDDRYYKADLVFYHRILKCHCIIELKAHRLEYSDMAQLNMYIEYYRKHYMQPDDNPPVGLLLCTEYGKEMVEYLAPFTDPNMFVAKYELQLPSKERIKEFLMRENGSENKN